MKTKKQKAQTNCHKLKFQDYEGCLEAAHTENKINDFEKNKIDVNSLNDFIKNNKLILKTQPRWKVKGIMLLLKKLIRLL